MPTFGIPGCSGPNTATKFVLAKTVLADGVGVPTAQEDWPNPVLRTFPQVFLGFVASSALVLLASLPVVVPRAANATRIQPVVARQDFQQSTPLTLRQVVAGTPFSQEDWPNPRARPYPVDLLTWFDTPQPVAVAAAAPFVQDEWPNPQRRAENLELRTWISTLITSVIPFSQTEWPNPTLARRASDHSWTQNPTALRSVAAGAPFSQDDWPNPRGAVGSQDLRTWLQTGVPYSLVGAPFAQDEWPVPSGAKASLELRTWLEGIPPPAPTNPPFVQADWPNPRGAAFASDLRTWARGFLPYASVGAPFYQDEWPNPRGPVFSNDFRTWLNPAAQSVQFPFSQDDWPNPLVAKRIELTWLQSLSQLLNPSTAKPFSQAEWPNPRGPAPIADQRTWLQPFGNALHSPPGPMPFRWADIAPPRRLFARQDQWAQNVAVYSTHVSFVSLGRPSRGIGGVSSKDVNRAVGSETAKDASQGIGGSTATSTDGIGSGEA